MLVSSKLSVSGENESSEQTEELGETHPKSGQKKKKRVRRRKVDKLSKYDSSEESVEISDEEDEPLEGEAVVPFRQPNETEEEWESRVAGAISRGEKFKLPNGEGSVSRDTFDRVKDALGDDLHAEEFVNHLEDCHRLSRIAELAREEARVSHLAAETAKNELAKLKSVYDSNLIRQSQFLSGLHPNAEKEGELLAEARSATTVVQVAVDVVYLKGSAMSYQSVKKFRDFLDAQARRGQQVDKTLLIDEAACKLLEVKFLAAKLLTRDTRSSWMQWDRKTFCDRLMHVYRKPDEKLAPTATLEEKLSHLRVAVDVKNATCLDPYFVEIFDAVAMHGGEKGTQTRAVELLIAGLLKPAAGRTSVSEVNRRMHTLVKQGQTPTTIEEYVDKVAECFALGHEQTMQAIAWYGGETTSLPIAKKRAHTEIEDGEVVENDNSKNRSRGSGGGSSKSAASSAQNPQKAHLCWGCGRDGHHMDKCPFSSHPDFNRQKVSFAQSSAGKRLKERGVSKIQLHSTKRVDGSNWTPPDSDSASNSSEGGRVKGKNKKGKKIFAALLSNNKSFLRTCYVSTDGINSLPVNVLFDTGAVQDNYVSTDVASWLLDRTFINSACVLPVAEATCKSAINLGGTSNNSISLGAVSFHFNFLNEVVNNLESLSCLKAKIMDTSFDLIIGLQTIRQNQLVSKIPSFFSAVAPVSTDSVTSAPVLCSEGANSCKCPE
jgi:hypothetical protein